MILYLDTTSDESKLILFGEGEEFEFRFSSSTRAEEIGSLIEKFLKTKKVKFRDLTKIAVKTGPGFFSRVRTGVAAANALGYALNLPIVPVAGEFVPQKIIRAKGQGLVKPVYGGKPNITKPKKRL